VLPVKVVPDEGSDFVPAPNEDFDRYLDFFKTKLI